MKFLFALLFSAMATITALSQPPKGIATKGKVYGQVTDTKGAIDVNELAQKMEEGETPVKVKGKVVDVCTKEGCWLKMETVSGKLTVKMKDHAFLVPLDIIGKEVLVDGIARAKLTSVEELRHFAEDAGKTKEEIVVIKEPKKEIVISANGIVVL